MSQMMSMGAKKCGRCSKPQWYKGTNKSTIFCGDSAASAGKCTAKDKGADKSNTTKNAGMNRSVDPPEGTHSKSAKGSSKNSGR